jgi:hypothetical protein
MLHRGHNRLAAERARKRANSARGRRRKARGQKVLRVTVDFWRISEWLYDENLLPELSDDAKEYLPATIEKALTRYIARK